MLDEIIRFAKEQAGEKLKSDHGLNDDENEGIFSVAQSSLFESLKGQIKGGNVNSILDLFNGSDPQAAGRENVASGVATSIISSLSEKFGFDQAKAGNIASSLVPSILDRFSSPETGTARDVGELVKKIGLDSDAGVASIVSRFTGDGGIGNLVKGMLDGK